MIKKFTYMLAAIVVLTSAAVAADFPSYYPKSGFQRVGVLDDVQLDRQVIIIRDIPYSLSSNVVVHSMNAYSVPATRLRAGTNIGYKTASNGRLIMEIWLLPNDYKNPRRR